MKAYDLSSRFTFGKYEGRTLEEVFKEDPSYVEKCMLTVEDFTVDERAIQQLFERYPEVEVSDAAIDANLDKLDALDAEDDDLLFGEEAYDDNEDFEGVEEGEDFDDDDDLFSEDDDFDADDDFNDDDDDF